VQRLLPFDKGNSTRSLLVFDTALAELQAQKVAEGRCRLQIASCDRSKYLHVRSENR